MTQRATHDGKQGGALLAGARMPRVPKPFDPGDFAAAIMGMRHELPVGGLCLAFSVVGKRPFVSCLPAGIELQDLDVSEGMRSPLLRGIATTAWKHGADQVEVARLSRGRGVVRGEDLALWKAMAEACAMMGLRLNDYYVIAPSMHPKQGWFVSIRSRPTDFLVAGDGAG